jgi:hypothetical protein
MHTHNLSQHVHRIGYHFPSTVVAAVCSELGLYLTSTGKAVSFHTLGTVDDRRPPDSEVSQEVINTEARDAIKDLFPNVPDKDLFQIIKTSFQKVCSLEYPNYKLSDRGCLTSWMSGSTQSRYGIGTTFSSPSPVGSGGPCPPPLH